MKLDFSLATLILTIMTLPVSLACSQSPGLQSPGSQSPNSQLKEPAAVGWMAFDDCPVILENRYVVPARESGIVASVAVELNAAVECNQLLLSLEKEEAESAVKSAKVSHAYALQVASDDSDLNLRKLALRQAEEELASNLEISKSVSASELRRLKLAVASAHVAVTNAERALKRQVIQADLAATALQAATVKLANREVRAPSDGIISEMLVRQGEWVDIGKPVMIVNDLRQLQVDCLLPIEKTDLKNLVGLDVRVESNHRIAGEPIRLVGKVTSYDSKLTAHGEVRVHCRVENIQQHGRWLLLPEMNVRLEIANPQHLGQNPGLVAGPSVRQ